MDAGRNFRKKGQAHSPSAALGGSADGLTERSADLFQQSSLLKAKLMDLTVDAAFVCDDTFHFCYINQAAELLTGYAARDLIGQPVDKLIPADLRSSHHQKMSSFGKDGVFAKGMQCRRPIQCLHKDGTLVKVSGTVTAIPSGGKTYFGVLLHDQTEYEALLKTVEQNQRELSVALEKAQRAISARSHFLGKASHELRTPLNAILGFSELMQASEKCLLDDTVKEYSGIIHKSGERLLKIVNQILEFSELSSDHKGLALQRTSLGQMLDSLFSVHIESAEEAGLQFHLKPGCECDVRVDYPRFRHAVANIIDNAIRYTRPGGSITIGHDHDRRGRPRITVTDTGIGIPKENLSKITAPFEQAENDPQKSSDGIGLGLSTSKSVIAMHGGRLRILSKPGEGTTVTITLPSVPVQGGPVQDHEPQRSKDDVFYI